MLATGDKGHFLAGHCQASPKIASNPAGPYDSDSHGVEV